MRVFRNLAILMLLGPSSWAQDAVKRSDEELHRLHQDSKGYIALLDDPNRDSYQKPHDVIAALGIREGEKIADIGAGSGYFSLRFAHHVGDSGLVYAVDINPDMIRHMNRRIRDMKLQNLRTILADPDDPLLTEGSVDRIFICDTWHHIEKQGDYLRLIKKILKPGGQVVMIDFQKRELPVGPPLGMKISREALLTQMEGGGFRLAAEYTFLPYQYFLVFTVKD